LGFGELRLRRENQVRRYYIDGGFAQVRDNIVTILTPQALKTEEINPEAVRQALEAARVPATTPDAQQSQYQAQQRARAQLRLAARPTEMEGH
jgi:F-type H+-transporting ATPase subunit epsilon